MPRTSPFVDALKKSLRLRGMTYRDLAGKLALSEPTIKRMFSRGTFTLRRIEQILRALDLDLYEVARMSRGGVARPAELTPEQESALARDERLLSVFWLVRNGWTFDEILEAYAVSKADLTLAFARLARADLVDWGPGERVRLKVERDFLWRAGGPVKKAYGNRVMQELLKGRFEGPAELLRFEARDVSEESAAVMRRRLERLAAEFNELAEIDASLPARRRKGFGVLLACRPWQFSAMIALKKRRT